MMKKEMKKGYATKDPHPPSFPASSEYGSQIASSL